MGGARCASRLPERAAALEFSHERFANQPLLYAPGGFFEIPPTAPLYEDRASPGVESSRMSDLIGAREYATRIPTAASLILVFNPRDAVVLAHPAFLTEAVSAQIAPEATRRSCTPPTTIAAWT